MKHPDADPQVARQPTPMPTGLDFARRGMARAMKEGSEAREIAARRLRLLRKVQRRYEKALAKQDRQRARIKELKGELRETRKEVRRRSGTRGALRTLLSDSPLRHLDFRRKEPDGRWRPPPPEVDAPPLTPLVCPLEEAWPEELRGARPDDEARILAAGERLGEAHATGRPLVVAAIADEFTREGLQHDCVLVDLLPETWLEQLEQHRPDLLFVESAFHGKDDTWRGMNKKFPEELAGILQWCRDNSVPSAFWNKEDPLHFLAFLRLAREFDWVFTTDVGSIPAYVRELKHRRVRLLPFAAQPRLHNPIEAEERTVSLCFAGACYPKYENRMRDFRSAMEGALAIMPVRIYDRHYGTILRSRTFPPEYAPFVVGTLDPGEIDIAYKSCRYALDVHTVTSSETMFARRTVELLLSGTLTVSGYSRGARNVFGDLVPVAKDSESVRTLLEGFEADPISRARLQAAGVRKVMAEHTYAERLELIAATLAGEEYRLTSRRANALLSAATIEELDALLAMVNAQAEVKVSVAVFTASREVKAAAEARGLRAFTSDLPRSLSDFFDAPAPVVVMAPQHWYGPYYLASLVDGLAYSEADVAAKPHPEASARPFSLTSGPAFWHHAAVGPEAQPPQISAATITEPLSSPTTLWVDPLDFALGGLPEHATAEDHSATSPANSGWSILHLTDIGTAAARDAEMAPNLSIVRPDAFPTTIDRIIADPRFLLVARNEANGLLVVPELPEDESAILWTPWGRIADCWPSPGNPSIRLHGVHPPQASLAVRWGDDRGKPLRTDRRATNVTHTLKPPSAATTVQFGLMIRDGFRCIFGRLFLGTPEQLARLT